METCPRTHWLFKNNDMSESSLRNIFWSFLILIARKATIHFNLIEFLFCHVMRSAVCQRRSPGSAILLCYMSLTERGKYIFQTTILSSLSVCLSVCVCVCVPVCIYVCLSQTTGCHMPLTENTIYFAELGLMKLNLCKHDSFVGAAPWKCFTHCYVVERFINTNT